MPEQKEQKYGTEIDVEGTDASGRIGPAFGIKEPSASAADVEGELSSAHVRQSRNLFWAALLLSGVLVVTIGGISAFVLYDYERAVSSLPSIPQNLAAQDAKGFVEHYRVVSDLIVDRSLRIYDGMVVKVLLPLLTALLGYLFALRFGAASRS